MSVRTVRVRYQKDGVFVDILEGEDMVAQTYEPITAHPSWEDAKTVALAKARAKIDKLVPYGDPPADEEFPLSEAHV